MINPHFEHNRVIWDDQYSGLYQPVNYAVQFDDQWRLFLEKKIGFYNHTGVETDDKWIDDRIAELTGISGILTGEINQIKNRSMGGLLHLDPFFPIDFFKNKYCLDSGCGAGRWTKTLQSLGAKVKSTDVSEHGLESVYRFNDDVERLNLFDILSKRKDLHNKFDFTLSWGVIMCTHNPKIAFENIAATVKKGGQLYIMVYAPTYHNSEQVIKWRKHYHTELNTFEERLGFAHSISDNPGNVINLLDMLNTFYNWVITEETVHHWFSKAGFKDIITLNRNEKFNCAWHVCGTRS